MLRFLVTEKIARGVWQDPKICLKTTFPQNTLISRPGSSFRVSENSNLNPTYWLYPLQPLEH